MFAYNFKSVALAGGGALSTDVNKKNNTSYHEIIVVWVGQAVGLSGQESAYQCRRCKRRRFDPWIGKIPWRRKWLSTPVFLTGESHGQRSLAGYSPWGCRK